MALSKKKANFGVKIGNKNDSVYCTWYKYLAEVHLPSAGSALICPLPRVIYGFKVINGGNGDLSLRKFSLWERQRSRNPCPFKNYWAPHWSQIDFFPKSVSSPHPSLLLQQTRNVAMEIYHFQIFLFENGKYQPIPTRSNQLPYARHYNPRRALFIHDFSQWFLL